MIPEGSKQDKNLVLERVNVLCRIESLILSLTEHIHLPAHIQNEEKTEVNLKRILKMIRTQNIDLTCKKQNTSLCTFCTGVKLWSHVYLLILKRERNHKREIKEK